MGAESGKDATHRGYYKDSGKGAFGPTSEDEISLVAKVPQAARVLTC
jgi:hypothetical protein